MTATRESRRAATLNEARGFADWILGHRPSVATGRRGVLGYVVLALAGSIIAFLRIPSSSLNTLWAEDASIFATDAYASPWWSTVLKPYAGYAHLYPRTIAAIVTSTVNMQHVPFLFAAAACAMTGMVGAVVAWTFRSRFTRLPRLLLWLLIVAMPIAGVEVNGSIANSHWYLLVAAFSVLATRQRGMPGYVVATVVVLTALLSDPLTILFAPLAAIRLFDGKPGRWLLLSGFAAGTLIQLLVVTSTRLTPAATRPTAGELLRVIGYRATLEPLLGSAGAQAVYGILGSAALLVGAAVMTMAVLVALTTPSGGLAVVAVAYGLLILVASTFLRWTPGLDLAQGGLTGGSRYTVLPDVLGVIAILAFWTVVDRWAGWAVKVPVVVVLVAIGVANLTSIVIDWNVSARATATVWSAEIDAAQRRCDWTNPGLVTIGETPTGFPLRVSCEALSESETRP